MAVYIHGLALQFYRGIGDDIQWLSPFRTFNFFIGANNSGKSTILNFISERLSPRKQKKSAAPSLDEHRGKKSGQTWQALAVPKAKFFEAACANLSVDTRGAALLIQRLVDDISARPEIWIVEDERGGRTLAQPANVPPPSSALRQEEWRLLWSVLTHQSGGDLHHHWIPQTINALLEAQNVSLPAVEIIPAIRQVGSKGSEFNYGGSGLVDRLAEIQSPDHDRRQDREIFDKINNFVREVTDKPHAQIEIPHHREHVLVHMDNKVLPLSSLGTGIHEVIMLAAFCTLSNRQIVCIEEPELHLHPLLQRKFIQYLSRNTENQYFIATHSSAFIDTPGAAIFHVKNDGDSTFISESALKEDRFRLCADLGYRASDLLQANAVIWVEGPSDRVYLAHWIRSFDPDLVEGIHYSIMFYGGRLLSHLSAESEEITEFISLRSLNRNMAVLIDSDKSSPQSRINATKQRILREFKEDEESFCWITQGREIENYVPHSDLQEAVAAEYPELYGSAAGGGQYSHALHFFRTKPRRGEAKKAGTPLVQEDIDKVAVARRVCKSPANLDVLDLRVNIQRLVQMIHSANS